MEAHTTRSGARAATVTRGLVFGKFYPPHRGHKYLIERAAQQCDVVTVIVMSSPGETIPGELRVAWLAEIHPNATILHGSDALPQSWPAEDEMSWATFVAFVRRLHPEPIDTLFTSEWYGPSSARRLGARHVAVDPQRAAVPISATRIRSAPWTYVDFLEPCVRAHYVRRVAIVGAESTGKTSLAQDLAAHFETAWVPEYGREYSAMVGQTADRPYDWNPADFLEIARVQYERESAAARTANRVLICDTDALATQVWQERYTAVPATFHYPRAAVYLLTSPDVAFMQDGTRDGEHVREWMTGRLEQTLRAEHLPFVRIAGDWDQRSAAAIQAVENVRNLA
jgi:HTH-type transcriptional repressor of NAD biosynthesis genes